ncbi:MAG: MFS transporter [Pseudomonadota bacterium]
MTAGDLHDTPYAWLRLALTLAIGCIGSVGMWAVIVVLPKIQSEFAIDRADAAIPYTICMVGFAIGSLTIGRWVDRFSVTPCLIGAALLQAAGFVAAGWAGSITLVAAAHLAIGFGSAACFAPLIADISHWFLRRRGIAVAVTASGNYLAGAIWPIILASILEGGGWRSAYLTVAVVLPITLLPMSLFLRRRVSDAARAQSDGAAQERAKNVGLPKALFVGMLFIAGISCCVAMSMPQVHIVALCMDLGFGAAAGAEMLSLMLFGGVVSRLVSGLLADRLGGVVTLIIGAMLQCVALFLYLPAGSLVSLYVVSTVFGLSQGGIVPSYSIIVREYLPSHEAGRYVGLLTFATIVGMAFGGWISGVLYDLSGSYRLAILNGIGWNVLNIALIGAILWSSRPRPAPA